MTSKLTRPDAMLCPTKYCFLWAPSGSSAGDAVEQDVTSAMESGTHFNQGGCACSLGVCRRESKNTDDVDFYEPNEPCLRRDGLPDQFFCDRNSLTETFIELYDQMAEKLWTDEQG